MGSRSRSLPAGRLPDCTYPSFRLAQVRKPGAAIIVATQALPELEPDVAQFRGTGGIAADAEYKSLQRAAFGEAVPPQPGGQVRCAERAPEPSGISVFPHRYHCSLPSRRQGPRGGALPAVKKVRLMRYGL